MFEGVLASLVGAVAVCVLVLVIRFETTVREFRYRETTTSADLPTVSVCIPARNEVHAMTECLERVLASDYPKLEIIVLDDSSVDDTSILIKSFAHAGVRFVEGRPLPEGWLGRNNALQGLLEEASGEFILYLDVDTKLRPSSISRLVAWTLGHQLPLVSVVPQREDGLRASVFLGTLRYFWVLFLKNTLSGACWLVHREKLAAAGGFVPFKSSTQPEEALARALDVSSHPLLMGSSKLGISYEKKWTSQVETSTRLLRPLFGSGLTSLSVAILLCGLVALPLLGLVIGATAQAPILLILSILATFLITALSLRYYKLVWRYGWWLGAIHWPYVLLQEAVLIIRSVYLYKRGRVTWKGRPIKVPIR